ncbi:MAG TPA: PP2C family serine/threonine-protein phosphatase [Ktedonobacteraceae bacterium]|jgi:protein phosphatase|nr:PP2C family serine/threonine-protein phosphatase [Ktedonobacteraceae bacterium]
MSQQKSKNRRKQSISEHHLPFKMVGYSIPCERHPNRNEDSYLIEQHSGLVAVYDGVGGSAAGEIASRTARRATRQCWKETLEQFGKGQQGRSFLPNCGSVDFHELLTHLIEHADEMVRTEGAREAGTDDLATTVAMAIFCREHETNDYAMYYAHVGDSRIYLLRENEPLKRLTSDDGLLGRLVENQMVNETDAHRIDQAVRIEDLSDIEFSYFRLRGGITQALGGPVPPTIHVDHIPISIGDRVLLCTDGIHDNLTDAEIEEILRKTTRDAAARTLVEQSLVRSREERQTTIRAKPDDMSAIVVTRRF